VEATYVTIFKQERIWKSQIGSQLTQDGATYTQGAGDINFAVGQIIMIRMFVDVPRGATINSATIQCNMIVKNGGTTQSSTHVVTACRADDTPVLVPGASEIWRYQQPTSAETVWTPVWPANPPGDVELFIDVKPQVQQIVNRANWRPGNFITFLIHCTDEQGSDMGIRANNDFVHSPILAIDYSSAPSDTWWSVNYVPNPNAYGSLSSLDSANTSLAGWYQSPFFGGYVDAANQGTLVTDASFTVPSGIPSFKFTTGTPPAANDKNTGVFCQSTYTGNESLIFCGWVYVPASVTERVSFEFVYFGLYTDVVITARNTWVPFCTAPHDFAGDNSIVRYASLRIAPPFTAGRNIWFSQPTILKSKFRQMPFTGLTPDKTYLTHHNTASDQNGSREWKPRQALKLDGVNIRKYPKWYKNQFGILQPVDTVAG
jgi:hypothetical protein